MLSFLNKYSFKLLWDKILDRLGLTKENPQHSLAKKILEEYGQNSLEYFKLWEDKSFYFSKSNKSFIAYRIFGRSAMVLGDPVGPYLEIEELINSFYHKCKSQDQSLCFFQTSSFFLTIYEKLDFQISTIGNEGLVNLHNFNLKEPDKVELREQMRSLDAFRYKVRYYKNPTDNAMLQKLQNVSSDWLATGEQERVFSLGSFSEDYIKTTTVMTVEDMVGNIVAFLNLVPSYKKNDLGVDLIRKSKTAPEGTIEYLLTHSILFFRELGYQRLSLGLIPLSTSSQTKPNFEDAIAKALLAKMSFLFSDMSLRSLKEKFINIVEPRYFTSRKQPKAVASTAPKQSTAVIQ